MPTAHAEARAMDERDAEILDDLESAFNEIADAYDLDVEQVRAIWLASLDPAEVAYAAGVTA